MAAPTRFQTAQMANEYRMLVREAQETRAQGGPSAEFLARDFENRAATLLNEPSGKVRKLLNLKGAAAPKPRLFVIRALCPGATRPRVEYVNGPENASAVLRKLSSMGCDILSAGSFTQGFRGVARRDLGLAPGAHAAEADRQIDKALARLPRVDRALAAGGCPHEGVDAAIHALDLAEAHLASARQAPAALKLKYRRARGLAKQLHKRFARRCTR
jgi:hypothetical protein